MKRLRKFVIVIVSLLSPLVAHADLIIVDTGSNNNPNANYSLSTSQWMAGQFSIDEAFTLTTIEGWLNRSNFGDLTIAIYSNLSGLPGTELYSEAFKSPYYKGWQGVSGVSWDLTMGTYFVSFEVRDGQSFSGYFPNTAISPLQGYAYTRQGNWNDYDPLNSSFRIYGVPAAVPEPGTLALFAIGLAGLGFMRSRGS